MITTRRWELFGTILGHVCCTAKLFSKVFLAFDTTTNKVWGFYFPSSSLAPYIVCHFDYGHSSGYGVVSQCILNCTSLVIDNGVHLFMCLFSIIIFFLIKCLCNSSTFLLGNYLFVRVFKNIYILNTSSLSDIWFTDSFFQALVCFFFYFYFLLMYFEVQFFSILMKVINW